MTQDSKTRAEAQSQEHAWHVQSTRVASVVGANQTRMKIIWSFEVAPCELCADTDVFAEF